MIFARARLLTLALLVALPSTRAAADPAKTPEAVVTALYATTDDTSPFFQTTSRKRVDRYFAPPLADLIWKDAKTANGEVGAIDSNPLYDAQDYEAKGLKVLPAKISGETAKVAVTFESYGEKRRIGYALVASPAGEWRIADILWAPDRTLLGRLKEAYPQ